MSVNICLDEVSFLEKTCRACCRYDPNDSMRFHPIFNGGDTNEPSVELSHVFNEFLLWNLEMKSNDGLPQNMCNDCLDRFMQVKLFREEVVDSQRLLSSYLKSDGSEENGRATITIETLPMSAGDDRVGYVSPSKLIEYVGSDEEDEEDDNQFAKACREIECFEANESDYLFNHPNQIETNDLMVDNPEPVEFKSTCNKTFEELSVDKEGKSNVEEKQSTVRNTKCDICMKSFRCEDKLVRHQQLFHARSDLTCPICGRRFENITQKNFNYHLRSHHAKKFKCSYCDKSFQQKVHLINHERVHTKEKPFACNLCGKKFRQQSSLQEHLMTHKDSHPFKCEICGKGFTHRAGLRTHLRLHDIDKRYQCEICGKNFNQKAHLDLHLMNHNGERPFQCEFCSKGFRQAYQLGNHMHSIHFSSLNSLQNGYYQCSQCDQEFTKAMDLIRHKKSHDSGERKFLCQQCGASFKRKCNLNLHVDAVHLKKKPFNCIYCSKTFAQLSNLNEHLKIHGGSKQHKCSFCDKIFTLKKTLLMHQAIHTGEKRFKCNFCDESFVYRQTLGTHIMNHFRDENEEEYKVNEEILSEDDFLGYGEDLELQEEFELDVYKLLG